MDREEIERRIGETIRQLGREGAFVEDVVAVLRYLAQQGDDWANVITNPSRLPIWWVER